jgi:hypothetical protein
MRWLGKLAFWCLQQAVSAVIATLVLTALSGGAFAALFAGIAGRIRMGDLTSWSLVFAGIVGWTVVLVFLVEVWRQVRYWRALGVPIIGKKTIVSGTMVPSQFMADPPKDPGPSINIHGNVGQMAVGNHNVQNQTIVVGLPGRHLTVPGKEALIAALRSAGPHTVEMVSSPMGDNEAASLAREFVLALQEAGWSVTIPAASYMAEGTDWPVGISIGVRNLSSPSSAAVALRTALKGVGVETPPFFAYGPESMLFIGHAK